jgi:glycosyltransferase involved in cell wall biosynthesis
LGRVFADRFNLRTLNRHETGVFCIDSVYRTQDAITARHLRENPGEFSGVYAYEDGAFESLVAARELGLRGIYDLPIGYWRRLRKLLESEFERFPEWTGTMTGFKDSSEKLDRKDAELAAASKIVVASAFTAQTLEDYTGKLPPCVVVPYGFPTVSSDPDRPARGPVTKEKPLRLLFVGGLSQRKGIADVFAAVNNLGASVSLTVVGRKASGDCLVLDYELSRHRWIPSLPHEGVLNEMRAHDVLVFPSLFEGFGLVITEAMSQGTPVITTERTAGPDLITHGQNGWLIKAGVTQSLVQQLDELVRSPEAVQEAGVHARKTAAARPWSTYSHELTLAMMNS